MRNIRSATWKIVLAASMCSASFFGCNEEESLVAPYPNEPRATIYLRRTTISPCETLLINVRFKNNGDTLIWLEYCCEPLRYYVTDISGRDIHWCVEDACTPCTYYDAMTVWPQHSISKTFSFCTGVEEPCMPTGIYLVHAGDYCKRYSWATAVFAIRNRGAF